MLRGFGTYLSQNLLTPLDAVTPDDVASYQRYLVAERKVSFCTLNQPTCALRFFYRTCLGPTGWDFSRMPLTRKPRTLPQILSPQEVADIFDACHNLTCRALLMTSYSGGLRRGKTLGLANFDIDSRRMVIRVEQGKGRRDRCIMLSPKLLDFQTVVFRSKDRKEGRIKTRSGTGTDSRALSSSTSRLRRSSGSGISACTPRAGARTSPDAAG